MASDPYKYFRVEATDLYAELGQGVLDLERNTGGSKLVPHLLRLAHTLKGAARVVKQREIADHAHALEEVLAPLRDSCEPTPRDVVDTLLRLLDAIATSIAALSLPAQPTAPSAVGRPTIDEPSRTFRADLSEVDGLLEGIGEAKVQLDTLQQIQDALAQARQLVDQLDDHVSKTNRGVDDKVPALARELHRTIGRAEQELSSGVDRVSHELGQVHDAAEHMRLVPSGVLFTALERAVRDVAQAQAKTVVFEGRGGELRVDAQVLGAVQGAALQLVRNAVAHGIEATGDRLAAGKPREGRVVFQVKRRGRRAEFVCSDDGRGVDADAVRRAARGLAGSGGEAQNVDTAPLLDLLLRGGLSTSKTVTELSGRGIGLDLLREAATRLQGELSLETEPGQGTAFRLVVPLSLTSVEALLVEAAGSTVGIPLDSVRSTMRIATTDLARTPEGDFVVHGGRTIPFVPLSRLLHTKEASQGASRVAAMIIEVALGAVALGVDRLVGRASLIQRPLPELAPASAVVAGTSMDASGNPRLILDPDAVVSAALGAGPASREAAPASARILVVDDSLTTRMLEQSILESAGYQVAVAASAEEALEKASYERFSLLLVDVEMPGMDGFSLIERARTEPTLQGVPCILVTSLSSEEHRQRGKAVGARGYIVKGDFDQSDLLQQIRQLLT